MPHLSGFGRPTSHLGAPSPEETLVWMTKFTQKGQYVVGLRKLAEEIVRELHPHDYISEYAAVLNWVRTNIRYSRDPRTIEQLKEPQVTVESETGDCDDLSILIGTLIGQLGGQVRFVAGAFKRANNGQPILSHVWAEAFDPVAGAWVILDPVPGRKVGQMRSRLIHRVVHKAID